MVGINLGITYLGTYLFNTVTPPDVVFIPRWWVPSLQPFFVFCALQAWQDPDCVLLHFTYWLIRFVISSSSGLLFWFPFLLCFWRCLAGHFLYPYLWFFLARVHDITLWYIEQHSSILCPPLFCTWQRLTVSLVCWNQGCGAGAGLFWWSRSCHFATAPAPVWGLQQNFSKKKGIIFMNFYTNYIIKIVLWTHNKVFKTGKISTFWTRKVPCKIRLTPTVR